MIRLTENIALPEDELEMSAVRAAGAGGQAVNKQSTAIHLRLDIPASSLPDKVKRRLLALGDQRISNEGVLVIKAREHRSQLQNRREAVERLRELVREVSAPRKRRIATRPGQAAKRRRVEEKKRRSETKTLRRSPPRE